MKVLTVWIALCSWVALTAPNLAAALVEVHRAPSGGIQPQAAIDSASVVHLIYYKGDQAGGDIYYVRRGPAEKQFSTEIKVNTQPGSAIAAGSIRGAQLAVGRDSRVHIVWNGGKGATKVLIGEKLETPLLYTRSDPKGGFEPERNMLQTTGELDGGSSVAADANGNVYVVWHGSKPGNKRGEAGRALYMARSTDDGKTFRPEAAISPREGVCACCGMRAFADGAGAVYVTYRAMKNALERDELFLVSPTPGDDFQQVFSHPWRAPTCPMSSTTLTPVQGGALAAWESDGQVYFATLDRKMMRMSSPTAPPKGARRRHPVAVRNGAGETLLVWTEGTAWAKGGAISWQIFDRSGAPAAEKGRADGLPVWGLPTAFVRADGSFEIIY